MNIKNINLLKLYFWVITN